MLLKVPYGLMPDMEKLLPLAMLSVSKLYIFLFGPGGRVRHFHIGVLLMLLVGG